MASLLKTFQQLLGANPERDSARKLYIASVTQARNPFFYLNAGVPDTLDGRFDLIVLHLFALHHQLTHAHGGRGGGLSRLLVEIFVDDMDRNLREMGVGDVGVGKRVRKMSEALYGRFAAYDDVLTGKRDWSEALRKNVYGNTNPAAKQVEALASYAEKLAQHAASLSGEALMRGEISFGGLITDSADTAA